MLSSFLRWYNSVCLHECLLIISLNLTTQHLYLFFPKNTIVSRCVLTIEKIYLYTWECRYSICLHYKRSAGFQPTNNLNYNKTEGVCRAQNSCQPSARFAVLRDLDKKLQKGKKNKQHWLEYTDTSAYHH